jgi:WS/DGAT/MGAT family acyltransferase
MAPVHYDEWMSPADALLWNNERDPMLRSTILSVIVLEKSPDEERFQASIERFVTRIPRLRQRVVLDPLGAAPPRWEADANFDLAFHLRRVGAPGAGRLRDLFDLAAPVVMQAFDRDRPLWELHRVDGLEGGRCALLMKLHHAISDGVGLVRMTSSLIERSAEAPPPRAEPAPSLLDEPSHGGAFEESLRALRHRASENLDLSGRALGALGRAAVSAARGPVATAASGARLASSLVRLLRPVSEPMSPLLRGRSLASRLDAFEVPLADLKRAGHAVDGTVNDAFVGAITGALRLYHEHHGRPVSELRMTMPINLREGEAGKRAGNRFAPARFAVPIGMADPAARMRAIHERAAAQREEPALPAIEEITTLLARLPGRLGVGLFGSMLKAVDFVTSNVPGPPFPVYSSGARVERMIGFGPLSGAALNVTLFSYDGVCQLGIHADRAALPDPELFLSCLDKATAEILAVA